GPRDDLPGYAELDPLHVVDRGRLSRVPLPGRVLGIDAQGTRADRQAAGARDVDSDVLRLVHLRAGHGIAVRLLLLGGSGRAERRQVGQLLGLRGGQRLLYLVREDLLAERVEQERALLRGLVLGQRQRVERLDVAGQAGVRRALGDLAVEGDHVGDRG